MVYGDIIETSTDFDEDTTIGVFINSVIDNATLIDKHANYLYASIACDEKVAKAIVNESDYSDFGIWKEKSISTYRDNASVYFVKDELILGKIYTDKDVVKLDDNKQYVVIPESLIANTLLNTNGGNSNVVSGYNYSALNAVFDKEALLDHYHDIVSEITKHDLILNRGVSLELEKIHLSDVSSDVRTNGGWGKLYKEVSGKELNESGFGTVKICDGLYGIKDGLFNIYGHSNKEYGINEF